MALKSTCPFCLSLLTGALTGPLQMKSACPFFFFEKAPVPLLVPSFVGPFVDLEKAPGKKRLSLLGPLGTLGSLLGPWEAG